VSYVYRLPLKYKMQNGLTKIVLRQAISDAVPDWVLERRKQGFGAPVNSWFSSRLGEAMSLLLDDAGVREHFNTDKLREALASRAGGGSSVRLWPIFNFALWHHYWIQGESVDDILEPVLNDRSVVSA
jgi:asparagine synthase (glutamine-hydrolysing)